MKLALFFISLFITQLSFSQTDTSFVKTIFAKDNYQIQYPTTWRIDTSKIMGTAFFVFSPLENATDKFSENVNMIIQDLAGQNIDLKAYKEISDKQLIQMAIGTFKSSIVKKDNKEFFQISYSMTQDKFKLQINSICFIKDEKAYLVTFSSEVDKYNQYKKIAEEILSSFSLTK